MHFFSPKEITENFSASTVGKSKLTILKMILLGMFAGMLVAFSAAVTSTATHTIVEDAGRLRMITGLLFGFGTSIAVVIGTELFTGNSLMIIGVLDRKITLGAMFKNIFFVFLGNLLGASIVSAGVAFSGQMNMSANGLATFAMKLGLAKMTMPFQNAFIQAALCCMLIAFSVLISSASKDLTGKMIGAYIPIMFFVACGFNHCVADMFYCIVALFAKGVPAYVEAAATAGIDLTNLTWGTYITGNLLPTALGNLVGGMFIGVVMWMNHVCSFKCVTGKCECAEKK